MINGFLKINKLVYLFAPLQLISSSFKEAIPLDNINDNISNEIINIEKIESSDIIDTDTEKKKTTNIFYFILVLILVVLGVIVYLIWKKSTAEQILIEKSTAEQILIEEQEVNKQIDKILIDTKKERYPDPFTKETEKKYNTEIITKQV
jgi:hypothetical protein